MGMNEKDFVHSSITQSDLEMLGFDENPLTLIEDHWTMAHIMHSAGVFSSVSQARKNGWNKPILKGFSKFEVGKKKTLVSIFNEISDGGPINSKDNLIWQRENRAEDVVTSGQAWREKNLKKGDLGG